MIDLGSNSWRLVVFTYAPGSWWKLTDELYETVRIGAGLDASGRLSDEAIARGLETLTVFERFYRANDLEPKDVYAIATSAIRDARNQAEFLERARAASGLEIEVLSAEDEARYGYVAAINTSTLRDGVVVELGGGSMQLIEVSDRRAQDLRSFALGAVRMTEKFLPAPARSGRRTSSASGPTSATAWPTFRGSPPRAARWSAWAARRATWPPRCSTSPGSPTSASRDS